MTKIFTLTAVAALMTTGAAVASPQKYEARPNAGIMRSADLDLSMKNKRGKEMKLRLNAPARAMEVTPVVRDVEGRVEYLSKATAGYYLYDGRYLDIYENYEMPATIVYGDDNEVWIPNIITMSQLNTYTKGVIEGNKITVSLPQTLDYDERLGYGVNLCVLKYYETETDANYELADDIDSITYTLNPDDGSFVLDLPGEFEEYMLGLVYTDDSTWTCFGEIYQEYSPYVHEVMQMPEGVDAETYYVVMEYSGYPVEVAFADDYIYFKGFCERVPDGVVRARYDAATGKAYVPQNQVIGHFRYEVYVMTKVVYGSEDGKTLTLAPADEEYELVVDVENRRISSAPVEGSPYLCFNCAWDKISYLSMLQDFVLKQQDTMAGTPKNPYELGYSDIFLDAYGYHVFYFFIPTTSTADTVLDSNCLYYRIFVDDELMEFEYNPDTDEYWGINGTVTDVPFDFNNGNDFYMGSALEREIGIYIDGIETMGVQSVYKYEGVETRSALMTVNVETGEVTAGVNAIREVTKAEYFDLQGRRVSNPADGIFVERLTLSDGTITTRKVARR